MNATVRSVLERTLSLVLAGIVITLVFLALAVWLSRGQVQAEAEATQRTEALLEAISENAQTAAATNRALGCTLLLPTKELSPGVIGRDVKDGIACWTDEGQEPPSFIAEG